MHSGPCMADKTLLEYLESRNEVPGLDERKMNPTEIAPPPNESATISSADLLRECGQNLTDAVLWTEFQRRFRRKINLYLLRTLRTFRSIPLDPELVRDFVQEVYVRLVQNDGRRLRLFRGTTEFSVLAFLARISRSVIGDHYRSHSAGKRQGQTVSIDDAAEILETSQRESADCETGSMGAILSLIDVQKALDADPDKRNAARNLLIFKLHYIDGFTAAEIAEFPGFALTESGVAAVVARLRRRLRE